MKRLSPVFLSVVVLTLFSCAKEYSLESSSDPTGNGIIIGTDCRISKIAYHDTTTGLALGSLIANINTSDNVTNITKFDSLAFTIDFVSTPFYASDTVFINADEYFLVDLASRRIKQLHALLDPTDPFSLQYEVFYFYDTNGFLNQKFFAFTSNPGIPFYLVNYTYSSGKMISMTGTDLFTGDLVIDAQVDYYSNVIPKRFLYIFPDEEGYPYFSQFYNFGTKPTNGPKSIKVRNYDPGNVLRDSIVSVFGSYVMSRDNYVLSVIMTGDDQPSIPAPAGKLSFSYKCK
ncbi:MAG TPA: hypothetical protein PLZ45_12175 [Ferruginibacter sp.]|nr:hypothetical protein [Chitinophagaceae bacterium]HRI25426.1 hypothetical protein [Ferruginibacter sp.]